MIRPGCKDCQNDVLKEALTGLTEKHQGTHDLVAQLAYGLRILVGINQRLLEKYEEAEGTPKGSAYAFSQASPAQNTAYIGKPIAVDAVIRHMVISGPGNVSVILNDTSAIGGAVTLAIVSSNGGAVAVNIRHKMRQGSTLSIQTDAAGGTGLVALTAWIEPVMESSTELFRLRR